VRVTSVTDQGRSNLAFDEGSPDETDSPVAVGGEEAALVHRMQNGDEMDFRHLVEHHRSRVFRVITRLLSERNEVEDIAQQVFAKVYASIRNFDFRSSLSTWIHRITVNECYDYLRRKRVRKVVYENEFLPEHSSTMDIFRTVRDPSIPVDRAVAQRDFLMKLLARLCKADRSLLMLKEVDGCTVEELADMTGLNRNTVKVRLFRIRQQLIKVAQRLHACPRTTRQVCGRQSRGGPGSPRESTVTSWT